MALVLHRTIHPVGQGAFYSEIFENDGEVKFSMVYDCGTKTSDKIMDETLASQIDEFSKRIGNKKIDLLCISHFHNDHISGLNNLTKICEVKKTIIPMLTYDMVLLTRVRNLISYREKALVTDNIIHSLYFGESDNNRFGVIESVFPYNDGIEGHVIPQKPDNVVNSGDELVQDDVFWLYRPFNSISPHCQKAIELKQRLLNEIPSAFSQDGDFDATIVVREYLEDLKKVYKDIMKGDNDNLYTLVVESSPVMGIMPEDRMKDYRGIYFGDFDYKSTGVRHTLLSPYYYHNIGFVQVPHHGSKHNWHADFLRGAPRRYVISAGTTNGHHHPSYWVVEEIVNNGNIVNVVSEKKATKLELKYDVSK